MADPWSAICVIPARGGSKRIPRKNLRLFHGRPILVWSILTARSSCLFRDVVISTEDAEIAHIAMRAGAAVLWRPDALADDTVGTQEVVAHALGRLPATELCCCVYATAPLMCAEDLLGGRDMLRRRPDIDFVFSANCYPEAAATDAGQFYWGRWSAFAEQRPLWGGLTLPYAVAWHRCCDINTEEDWLRAERMYKDLYV